VEFVFEMFRQGVNLLDHDSALAGETVRTIQLAGWSTLIAAILGFPTACAIGLGRAHVSRGALTIANAGIGLPPVGLGVICYLLLPDATMPWGGSLRGTMSGMVVGQTLLAIPVIVALGAIAIRRLPHGLVDQARAYGATGWRLGMFALREARVGAVAAVIVAMGSAIAEVGAVTIIGGNAYNTTATLASQILNDVNNAAHPVASAVEHLLVLLALMLVLGVAFTLFQQWDGRFARRRAQHALDDLTTMEAMR
jgi:tungstate transport system permease protein